ncbi:Copia protein, partial [Mucuna pruriens]
MNQISYFSICITNHLSIQHQIFIVVIDASKTLTSVQKALKDENWVQLVKCKFDETLDQYKTRLISEGYTQTYGIDYEETFVPIAKINTIRVILSLTVHFGWNLQQFDVKNVFLHGDLEEVYMEILPGFYSHNEKNKITHFSPEFHHVY